VLQPFKTKNKLAMRKAMPSQDKIWNYWKKKYLSGKLNGDKWNYVFEDDKKVCFACCFQGFLERCHITSHCEGGSEDVSNIHLLCKGCHQRTEPFGTKHIEFYYEILEHKTLWNQENEIIFMKMIAKNEKKAMDIFKKLDKN
tara:strand:+ start:52 stop:477 length:426 start_codon:yes stop_codon:yes gene_type:complete